MCQVIINLLVQKEVHTIQEGWQKQVSRKGYLKGTRGWENFLLSDAPGLGLPPQRTMPKSIVQIMPPVASRIIAGFERDERAIIRFVQQVC